MLLLSQWNNCKHTNQWVTGLLTDMPRWWEPSGKSGLAGSSQLKPRVNPDICSLQLRRAEMHQPVTLWGGRPATAQHSRIPLLSAKIRNLKSQKARAVMQACQHRPETSMSALTWSITQRNINNVSCGFSAAVLQTAGTPASISRVTSALLFYIYWLLLHATIHTVCLFNLSPNK